MLSKSYPFIHAFNLGGNEKKNSSSPYPCQKWPNLGSMLYCMGVGYIHLDSTRTHIWIQTLIKAWRYYAYPRELRILSFFHALISSCTCETDPLKLN